MGGAYDLALTLALQRTSRMLDCLMCARDTEDGYFWDAPNRRNVFMTCGRRYPGVFDPPCTARLNLERRIVYPHGIILGAAFLRGDVTGDYERNRTYL